MGMCVMERTVKVSILAADSILPGTSIVVGTQLSPKSSTTKPYQFKGHLTVSSSP
jgi:hypothetical protein